jgi:MFS superfamily sulfate permease-like transporter
VTDLDCASGQRTRIQEPLAADAALRHMKSAPDVIAGLSVAGLLLPEAVAYSSIASLPAQSAIIALLAGLAVYTIMGTSRYAIVSATSSSAALLAAAVLAQAGGSSDLRLALGFGLVVLTGVVFLLAALARVGSLTDFIAKPVLRGFAFGISLVIIIKQLPTVLAVKAHHADLARYLWDLLAQFGQWSWPSIGVGVVALALLFALARWPRVPGALAVIILGVMVSVGLDLPGHGVESVGAIAFFVPAPGLPVLPEGDWFRLGEVALALMLVLYAESSGSIRSFAVKHGDPLAPNRDLLALGVANIASGLLQGMPVGAGYSATSANEAAGAQSRMAAGIAFCAVGAILLTLLRYVAYTPAPVLAAIVIHAVSHTLRLAVFKPYLAWRRDRTVLFGAILAVLVLGVLDGLLAAIAISLALLMRRLAQSNVVELGRLDGGHDFVDCSAHPGAIAVPGVLVLRPAEPLFFVNAERIMTLVRTALAGRPHASALVLSLEETPDLDTTTIEALGALAHDVAAGGCLLLLARLTDAPADILARARLPDLPASAARYFSVDDAVTAAQAGLAAHHAGS